jgi:hypothetical protein
VRSITAHSVFLREIFESIKTLLEHQGTGPPSPRKEGLMLDVLDEMQWRLAEMQASLHDRNTITPARRGVISHPEARKNVLWYLDSFSAAVAAARAHLNKVEENEDNLYTTADQAEIRARIGTRMDNEFEALKRVIEKYFYCQERHLPRPHLVPVSPIDHELATEDTGKLQRQVMRETLGQLELLDQALDPLRKGLRASIAKNTSGDSARRQPCANHALERI